MLFKKEIRTTRNLEELNKIRDTLSQNGIETSVVTNAPTNPGRHHGVPCIDASAAYQYQIYVANKDEKKALQLTELNPAVGAAGIFLEYIFYYLFRRCIQSFGVS